MKREFGRIIHDKEKEPVRYELNSYPNAEHPHTFFLRTAERNQGGPLTTEMVQAIGTQLIERYEVLQSTLYVQGRDRLWHELSLIGRLDDGPVTNPVKREHENRFDEKFAQYELEANYKLQLARSTKDYIVQSKIDSRYMEGLAKQARQERLKESVLPYTDPHGDVEAELEHEARLLNRVDRAEQYKQFKQGFGEFCQRHQEHVWPAYLQHVRDKEQQQQQQAQPETQQQTQQQRQRR